METALPRRSFIEYLASVPLGAIAPELQTAGAPVVRVAAGTGRADDVIKLPGGDLVYVKVATQDTGGALFMTEQPNERRGSGPPKHYHENQDEWFYCLAGEYVVEVGTSDSDCGQVTQCWVHGGCRTLLSMTAPGQDESSSASRPQGAWNSSFEIWKSAANTSAPATAADKETAQRLYGIVNVGPPLKL